MWYTILAYSQGREFGLQVLSLHCVACASNVNKSYSKHFSQRKEGNKHVLIVYYEPGTVLFSHVNSK